MAKDNFMKKIFLLFVLILAACTFQTNHRGYVFPEDLESKIATIKTTAQLQEEIGDPQTRTIYGDEVWIYYGADENMRGPWPKSYDNKTVLLAWVKGGRVIKTQILRDDDLQDIKIADGETEIPAAIELNALEELVNNIGRFSPAGLGQ
jgi:outer membrane protein assembly factor BamE (lipoprotein component of BamABCDE complex)